MFTRATELLLLFGKLGIIGFGGPAVHIVNMQREVVDRREWMTTQQFLDLLGVTNLIPGPNSTEMAMHVGYHRAGWPGLIAAGFGFIIPAALMTGLLAFAYVTYGQTPALETIMMGIQPVVIAIIFGAGWKLARKAVTNYRLGAVALGTAALILWRISPIQALLLGSLTGLLAARWTAGRRSGTTAAGLLAGLLSVRTARAAGLSSVAAGAGSTLAAVPVAASYWKLGLFFFKVGAVLYGTGYVLIAYLQDELVGQYGWLTQKELYDAFAIGNFTPGPILSTATFIGFIVMHKSGGLGAGVAGAAVATLAIFLPSFLLVGITGPWVSKLRNNPWTSDFLDAVNAASIGLIAAVTVRLCGDTLVDWQRWTIALVAATVLVRWKVASAWLILGGAAAGWVLGGLG